MAFRTVFQPDAGQLAVGLDVVPVLERVRCYDCSRVGGGRAPKLGGCRGACFCNTVAGAFRADCAGRSDCRQEEQGEETCGVQVLVVEQLAKPETSGGIVVLASGKPFFVLVAQPASNFISSHFVLSSSTNVRIPAFAYRRLAPLGTHAPLDRSALFTTRCDCK